MSVKPGAGRAESIFTKKGAANKKGRTRRPRLFFLNSEGA